MGCKRPFEDMDLEDRSFKHSRQLEHGIKTNHLLEGVSCNSDQKPHIKGKNGSQYCMVGFNYLGQLISCAVNLLYLPH